MICLEVYRPKEELAIQAKLTKVKPRRSEVMEKLLFKARKTVGDKVENVIKKAEKLLSKPLTVLQLTEIEARKQVNRSFEEAKEGNLNSLGAEEKKYISDEESGTIKPKFNRLFPHSVMMPASSQFAALLAPQQEPVSAMKPVNKDVYSFYQNQYKVATTTEDEDATTYNQHFPIRNHIKVSDFNRLSGNNANDQIQIPPSLP